MKEIGYTEKDVEIIKKYYHTYDFELINSIIVSSARKRIGAYNCFFCTFNVSLA